MSRYDDPHYGTGSRSAADFAALQARNAAARPEPIEDAILAALAPVNPDTGDDDARFTVTDKGGADWVARIVTRARQALADDEALYESEMAPINEWIAGRRAACRAVEDRWLAPLAEWHATERTLDHKGRPVNATIELPSGAKLVSRQGQAGVEVHDKDAFLNWADSMGLDIGDGALLRHIPARDEPDLGAIKKHLTPAADDGEPGPWVLDGEVVPGLIAKPAEVKFSLETPKGGE